MHFTYETFCKHKLSLQLWKSKVVNITTYVNSAPVVAKMKFLLIGTIFQAVKFISFSALIRNLNCMYLELCELSNEDSAMAPISCDASQTSEAEMDMAVNDPKVAMKPNQLKILCTTFGYFSG
ncbi:hypothetical protein TNCV_2306661 [Trichonephila clavipes]|nr:hypothetical protein TNCV_2306661 [Trichonephila clavipes]